MPTNQQSLKSISYIKLKNIRDVEISFMPHSITGIFGVNGCGKSTILHSLLCLYKPHSKDQDRRNFKFSEFFTPTSLEKWVGSEFVIKHSYIESNGRLIEGTTRCYEKKTDRWSPRYERRPARNVYYIGIDTCVPDIEIEKKTSYIDLSSVNINDGMSATILSKMSAIMNRSYNSFNNYSSINKKYIGVDWAGLRYSSLSMGAGEQRLFRILDTVFRAPKYSLIIIDEIELTLHTYALTNLIQVLKSECDTKNKQIIFTSHREELAKRQDINVRHIYQTLAKTICLENSTPECIYRLTGSNNRMLDIFVEDDLAATIVNKIAEQKRIRKYCSVHKFGAIDNAFTLASGLVIRNDSNINNCLILTDGDLYKTPESKAEQLQKRFSGTETNAQEKRNKALSLIKQFRLPGNTAPEEYIYECLKLLSTNDEIIDEARQIQVVQDTHEYLNAIIEKIGYSDKLLGYQDIVNCFSQSEKWGSYIEEVSTWLDDKIQKNRLV